MEISAGTKSNLVFILKWVLFWGVWAFIDEYFDLSLFDIVTHTPAYYCGLISIALMYLSGQVEARYMFYKFYMANPDSQNAHIPFTLIRLISSIPIFIMVGWKVYLCYVLMFPFIHDGSYYTKRNELNPAIYQKKWFAQSDTSLAWFDKIMNPFIRTGLAILGFVGIVISILASVIIKVPRRYFGIKRRNTHIDRGLYKNIRALTSCITSSQCIRIPKTNGE